jgi:hypothetical protein
MTVQRLEAAGKLNVVKFQDAPNARAHHRADDVIALARRGVTR